MKASISMSVGLVCAGLVCAGLAGCGGGAPGGAAASGRGGAGRGGRGGMGAFPVQVEVVKPRPVASTSSYVASIQSLHSLVVTPLVGGIIRQIFVNSGEAVKRGAPIAQIDPTLQAATVANLENSQASLRATAVFDRQQLRRAEALYEEKIGTEQDLQQAQSTYSAAEAQLQSLEAQIRQAKVTLSYFRVTAPRDGIVGDIPVKVGDQVTTATELTTLDAPQGLQLYVQVPTEDASRLRVGLPVEVETGTGAPITSSHIFFISPQVDYQTQTILAKANLPAAAAARVRTQQYVQAKIIWGTRLAITVPVLAVTQQGTTAYVDLAARRGAGYAVAPKTVQIGQIYGNDYEVLAGLTAGEQVIVSSHQILQPGMPVMPREVSAAAGGR
jgi:RND family efflux transporter MFP subunit